jgi:NAD(P)-dependent dehydrogenase (short-subunit alcohol dehydrogenase family)
MGRASALLFAQEGARIAGCDLKLEEAAETVELVRAAGGEMISSAPVDLGDEAAAHTWVREAVTAYGGIDVLFNNASSGRVGRFADLTSDDWHYTIRNELDLVYHVTSAVWPHLVARGGGTILNMSSMAALRGAAFYQQAAHAAAKGGVLAFTYHLAAAGGPHRIRANAIAPGLIRTPQTEFLYADPDGPGHQLARANPLGRTGYPEDVAKLALFLASDDAWYVNAAVIPIDGGQAMIV